MKTEFNDTDRIDWLINNRTVHGGGLRQLSYGVEFTGLREAIDHKLTGDKERETYKKSALDRAKQEGATTMLESIRGSLRGYPNCGGDVEVMREVERIVGERLAQHQLRTNSGQSQSHKVAQISNSGDN